MYSRPFKGESGREGGKRCHRSDTALVLIMSHDRLIVTDRDRATGRQGNREFIIITLKRISDTNNVRVIN